MAEPIERINTIQHELHLLNRQGHITEADEFSAIEDLQADLHRLRQAFEWNGKIDGNRDKKQIRPES